MSKEEIKNKIKEKYPNLELKNDYFLEPELVKEFSVDTLALKLCQLDGNTAYKLSIKLKFSSNMPYLKDMIKFIIEENPKYFENIEIITIKNENIIEEYTRLYSMKNHTLEELKEVEKRNIELNKDNYELFTFDINYYNELIIIQKLLQTKEIKQNDVIEFIIFTKELLKQNIIKDTGNYDINYDKYINEIISHILIGNISPSKLYSCINHTNKINNLLLAGKFQAVIYELQKTPLEVIDTLKTKQIYNIYREFVVLRGYKNIKSKYSKKELLTIFTNMSVLLEPSNVTNIIRHLPEEEKVERLFETFKKIDLSKVKTANNLVLYNNEFINFFIGNNLNEPNSLLNLIYNDQTTLKDKIEGIYAEWDNLNTRYKNQTLKTRLAFIEEALSNTNITLNPDEYLLEGNIINSYYDNKRHQNLEGLTLIDEVRKEYANMKHNYQKTIPYINGTHNEYYYEMLPANDPNLFILGAITDDCFKIGGHADSFVKYCARNINGRVLVVKDNKNNIVGAIPMYRNGNLIVCNSVETNFSDNKYIMENILQILEEASNKIIDISSKVEKDEHIQAIIIEGFKDKEYLTKYKTLDKNKVDDSCLKLENIYTNVEEKHEKFIISSIPNFSEENLKNCVLKVRYLDPRPLVLELEKEFITEQTKKQINSIYYEKEKRTLNLDNIEKVIFTDDWLIIIDKKYKIESIILTEDERAKEEYQEYLELAKEHCSYYNEDGSIKEEKYYK